MVHGNVRRMLTKLVSMNEEREIQLPDISPHILRHTCTTRLAEAGLILKCFNILWGIRISEQPCGYTIMWTMDV